VFVGDCAYMAAAGGKGVQSRDAREEEVRQAFAEAEIESQAWLVYDRV
jgi:hypothetical protein